MLDQTEEQIRLQKLAVLKSAGMHPYPEKFAKKQTLKQCYESAEGTKVQTAGRLVMFRDMGKLTFAHLQDWSGRTQIAFRHEELGEENYKLLQKVIDLGDFLGVEGEMFRTHKGEITVMVKKWTFLGKALRPLPEKWHGLQDVEAKYRQRYLDLISNTETMERFKFRSEFIKALREFYWKQGFIEIETPVLCNTASGALARPFVTHHKALNADLYLRIAPEIYLKEAVIGGFDKIFEVARVFRNEGIDPSHLQDFTMVEHYAAYWNFEMNMAFTEKMLTNITKRLKGSLKLTILSREQRPVEVDLTPPWKRIPFRNLLMKDCGIDIDNFANVHDLKKEIIKNNIFIEDIDKLGRGNLIDELYKKVSRPKLINPTFLTQHPIDLSPLARKNDDNPLVADRFQLILNGWEVLNAYSELVDPLDQQERFAAQTNAKSLGDEEAMTKDDEYVDAMKYGMPPISGWGMGIERIVALLTRQVNLKDVVLFPLMKPTEDD